LTKENGFHKSPSAQRIDSLAWRSTKMLAFVLGGGGARGAMQVGALRALLEANIRPGLLVGTSIGAVNAAHLALRGLTLPSIDELTRSWIDAATANLLPSNLVWLVLCALFAKAASHSYKRLHDFFVAHGLSPELRFGDIQDVRLILVAADLNTGRPVLFGQDPQDSVLEGVLASSAVPPWIRPLEKNGRALVDGGALSGMSIQAAMEEGATEVVALDLDDYRGISPVARGFFPDLSRFLVAMQLHQTEMELALARARSVPVRRIALQGSPPVAIWDFRRTKELIEQGYLLACEEIGRW
jgi:NTE family protein